MANVSIRRTGSRLSARLQQSASVLRNEGAIRFLQLSALSLAEPVRSLRLRIAVSADARGAIVKIRNGKYRRGLFIDCGSNIGQGYAFFRKYYISEYFDYIMVEPNKNCMTYLREIQNCSGASIDIISKAASVRDGFARLFGPPSSQAQPTYEGRSIVPEHNSSLYRAENGTADIVETFSLSDLILTKSGLYDVLVLKMDVEGAEYELLIDMIRHGTYQKLYSAYVEFHSVYMKKSDRLDKIKQENNLINYFRKAGIIFRKWV